jgi:hypothetical protein
LPAIAEVLDAMKSLLHVFLQPATDFPRLAVAEDRFQGLGGSCNRGEPGIAVRRMESEGAVRGMSGAWLGRPEFGELRRMGNCEV